MSKESIVFMDVMTANNSSGIQSLDITATDLELWFTAYGKLNGQDVQIDFDSVDISELDRLIYKLERVKRHMKSMQEAKPSN